jgi:HK97 family phage prohead protease
MEVERRIVPSELEVRTEGNGFAFRGYAAVFNQLSEDLGGFREQVAPKAFNKTLKEADIRALINHDPNLITGRNTAGTLRLSTDSKGLIADNDLPDTSYARDVYESLQRGDVNQMSFAFTKIRDSWAEDTKPPTRTLDEVRLHDVSVVTYPAYPQTSAEARALAAALLGDPLGIEGLDVNFRTLEVLEKELREGKTISRKNMDLLKAAIEALTGLLQAAEPDPATQAAKNSAPADGTTQTPLSVLEAELALKDRDLLLATI